MAIQYNENIKIAAPNPLDKRYLSNRTSSGAQLPYSGVSEVINPDPSIGIIPSERYSGLTVLVQSGTTNAEYWFKDGVGDGDLIEKKYDSMIPTGDFVTGATNLGYFSGTSNVQTLAIDALGSTNDGNYLSLYNYYYIDDTGTISIGSPTPSTPLRRGYVRNTLPAKSWIYSYFTGGSGYLGGWQLIDADISNSIGLNVNDVSILVNPYSGTQYTETEWWYTGGTGGGYYNNAGNLTLQVYGDLYSGTSFLTVGARPYAFFDHNNLHFRTVISDTPDYIKVNDDDSFIRISGVTSVITAKNYGTGVGVYSGKTGNELKFRTLVASGDTTITTGATGNLVIYSSSDGSADAITGATNYSGGSNIYSGTTDRNLQLRSIVGSGSTTVTTVGGNIVINSSGGDVFTSDITVSIASGKTFGKYVNGQTIPASGKTANQVIELALAEALAPTLTLGSSATDVIFGQSGKTVNVTFSYTINTVGASPNAASAVLEWRRGGAGSWSGLTSDTGDTNYFHTVDDSADRFNTAVINYRYTVVDTGGGSGQTTYDVVPQAYAVPSINYDYDALSLQSYETKALREVGNVDTDITGNITSNRSLINLTEYRILRDDGSGYVIVASATSINALTKVITPYLDTTPASNATTISYKVEVDDEYQSGTTSAIYTISLRFASFFGYSTLSVLNSTQIKALGNEALLASRVRTVDPVTAPASNYTYISYPASFGDLTNIIMDGAAPVLGSFTKLTNVSVTNYYGEVVSNIIYKSNAPAAFNNNELAFS